MRDGSLRRVQHAGAPFSGPFKNPTTGESVSTSARADRAMTAWPPGSFAKIRWLRMLWGRNDRSTRSEEHTSELQSLMRISYAVFCLTKKKLKKSKTRNKTLDI